MTPKPTDLCGHANCRKPYSEHFKGERSKIMWCFDVEKVAAAQSFTPAPEPTKEESTKKKILVVTSAPVFGANELFKKAVAQHQEPQTPTEVFAKAQISDDEPDWERISKMTPPKDTQRNPAWAGAWMEGEMVGYARCMIKYRELKEENERLKAGEFDAGFDIGQDQAEKSWGEENAALRAEVERLKGLLIGS